MLVEASLGLDVEEGVEEDVEEGVELAAALSVLDEVLSVVLDELLDEVIDVFGDDTKAESTELAPSVASGDVVDSVVVIESPFEELIRLLNKASNEDCTSLLVRDDIDEPDDVVESSEDNEDRDDDEDEDGDEDEDSILDSMGDITGSWLLVEVMAG